MKVTPPKGILSADPPVYPGSDVDWKLKNYNKHNNVIKLSLPISVDDRTNKKEACVPIGKSKNETDDTTFRRAWDILNYIKSIKLVKFFIFKKIVNNVPLYFNYSVC